MARASSAQFDDSKQYYYEDLASNTRYVVKLPKNGAKIKILEQGDTSMRIRVFGSA